jgi:hypothetical protein
MREGGIEGTASGNKKSAPFPGKDECDFFLKAENVPVFPYIAVPDYQRSNEYNDCRNCNSQQVGHYADNSSEFPVEFIEEFIDMIFRRAVITEFVPVAADEILETLFVDRFHGLLLQRLPAD